MNFFAHVYYLFCGNVCLEVKVFSAHLFLMQAEVLQTQVIFVFSDYFAPVVIDE